MTHGSSILAQYCLGFVLWPDMHGMRIDSADQACTFAITAVIAYVPEIGAAKSKLEELKHELKSCDDLSSSDLMARGSCRGSGKGL